MEENSYLQNCSDDDVLAFAPNVMFKLGLFRQAVKSAFLQQNVRNSLSEALDSKGVKISGIQQLLEGRKCEILTLNSKGWQKGKFRIKVTLEFCPDAPDVTETSEPESPLDDIRRMMTEDNT